MDLTMEAWLLTVNPPMLAPKGFINKGYIFEPGGLVEYAQDELNDANQRPVPITSFSAGLRGFDFQDFFKRNVINLTYDEQTEKDLDNAGATFEDKERIRCALLNAVFADNNVKK